MVPWLTYEVPVFPSYRNHSIDLLCNQLTGFYMRATLALNCLTCCFTLIMREDESLREIYLEGIIQPPPD